ncbi:uncharacterized protein [Cherax quadricarinatus]|uniref:uncharacterized protein n=1 Tax=Cherax quadricarinatus TaxID=27406 RepID=UPI00387E49D7
MALSLTVATTQGKNHTLQVTMDDQALSDAGITKDDLETTLLHADDQGMVTQAEVRGQLIGLFWNISTTISDHYAMKTVDGGTFVTSVRNYTNVTVDDFDEDPNLKSADVPLTWSLPRAAKTNILEISLISGLYHASVSINDKENFVGEKESSNLGVRSSWPCCFILFDLTGNH